MIGNAHAMRVRGVILAYAVRQLLSFCWLHRERESGERGTEYSGHTEPRRKDRGTEGYRFKEECGAKTDLRCVVYESVYRQSIVAISEVFRRAQPMQWTGCVRAHTSGSVILAPDLRASV
jgi:hypothetical protein